MQSSPGLFDGTSPVEPSINQAMDRRIPAAIRSHAAASEILPPFPTSHPFTRQKLQANLRAPSAETIHSEDAGKDAFPTTDRLALNRAQAAQMLGISERLLWSWTKAGKVPHTRIGARVLYPIDELRRWINEQCHNSRRPAHGRH